MRSDPNCNVVPLVTRLDRLRDAMAVQLRTFCIDADRRAARRLGQLMVEFEDEREDRWPRRPSGRMLAPSEIKAKRRRGA